jgi:hypothetical protein
VQGSQNAHLPLFLAFVARTTRSLLVGLNKAPFARKNNLSGWLYVPVLYVTISPSHRNTSLTETMTNPRLEIDMTTQISTKLAALAVALMMNSLMIGAVAYLFSGHLQQNISVTSLAHTPVISAMISL